MVKINLFNKHIILGVLLIFFSGFNKCDNSTTNEIENHQSKALTFENILIIDEDKCREKELPITKFAIEYPDSLEVVLDSIDYFSFILRNKTNIVNEAFSITSIKLNIEEEKEALNFLKLMLISVKNQADTFFNDTVFKEKFNNRIAYIARANIVFPENEDYFDKYFMEFVIQFPDNKDLNAVLFYMFAHQNSEIQTFEDFENRGMIGKVIQTFRYIE